MTTHDKYNICLLRQTQKAIKTSSLTDIKGRAMDFDVVAIDEGQFFP